MKKNELVVAFTGGGTAGHIYPGLAIADELKTLFGAQNKKIKICWIGCSSGMDKKIVQTALSGDGEPLADEFYGIPSGKLRRYFSLQNFLDIFKIFAGFIKAFFYLNKIKPSILFSKGGFVSVPPCYAAKLLKIPVFTHECDFSIGLANRLNLKVADNIFLSYEQTKKNLSSVNCQKSVVMGNPVRPIFYNTKAEIGYDFLGLQKESITKPILLVLGGSSGARQINDLVYQNLDWICKNYIVVHQTGMLNNDDSKEKQLQEKFAGSYFAFPFIYEQMPHVLSIADVILSRAGANSIWEAAVLNKPMVLIPLCGSGTRGDQVDNANFFVEQNASCMLLGEQANSENLIQELTKMLDKAQRDEYIFNLKKLIGNEKPANKIANFLYNKMNNREML